MSGNTFLTNSKWLTNELKKREKEMKENWAKIVKYLAENGDKNKGETITIRKPKRYEVD